jgi:hypothetical protein
VKLDIDTSKILVCHHTSLAAGFKRTEIEKEIRMVITMNKVTEEIFWSVLRDRLTPLLSPVRVAHCTLQH